MWAVNVGVVYGAGLVQCVGDRETLVNLVAGEKIALFAVVGKLGVRNRCVLVKRSRCNAEPRIGR